MMPHTREEVTPNLAERRCWEVGRRDAARVARRLYSKPGVDGGYRLDEGALLAEFFHGLRELGVMTLLEEVGGIAMHRGLVPFVQSLLLYGLKTLVGVKRRKALPVLVCRADAGARGALDPGGGHPGADEWGRVCPPAYGRL
jgi:hypothetical protein